MKREPQDPAKSISGAGFKPKATPEQRDVETEIQRVKEPESQRSGDSETLKKQRFTGDGGDSGVPLLAPRVESLQEAAKLALGFKGRSTDPVFLFARAIKAFEITVGRRLPQEELGSAFSVWW